jgi:hypothetical protein
MGDRRRSAIAKGGLAIRDSHQFPDSRFSDSRFPIRRDFRFAIFGAIHDSPFQLAISNQQLAIR